MKLKYYAVFAFIVVLPKLLFCLRPRIKTGIFKVVKKHPNVRKCAEKILKEDEYSGGRVHELTGDCEGLNSSMSNKKTCDKGYAYIEQILFKQFFLPPIRDTFPIEISDWMTGLMRGNVLSFETTIGSFENPTQIAFAGKFEMRGTYPVLSSSSFLTIMEIVYKGTQNDGSKVLGNVDTNKCAVNNVVRGEKTRFSFKFETNVSMEVIIDNSIFCRLDIEQGNLGNINYLLVSKNVHSISFG